MSKKLGTKCLERGFDISLLPATGAADGWSGDHFLLAPPYLVTEEDIAKIVNRVGKVIDAVLQDLEIEGKSRNSSP